MANPPNFTDLARKQRLAVNNRLSFNSVVNGGSPVSQGVAISTITPAPTVTNNILTAPGLIELDIASSNATEPLLYV